MFNAPGTRMELNRNVYVRRPKHAELLENFKHVYFLSQTRTKHTPIFSEVQRRAPDKHQGYPTYPYRVLNLSPTGVWRIWNFCNFYNTLGARFTYTLMCGFNSTPDAANLLGNFRKIGRFPARLRFFYR